ncbi:hypothetical protein Ddc_08843 [Ditylenchus destructor]|nr:hypothetical protein Ddc_08843 [Ditylenchus destructor]
MSTSFVDYLWDLCCCKGICRSGDEDDNERLIRNDDYGDEYTRTTVTTRHLNNGVGSIAGVGTSRGNDIPVQPQTKVQQEVEDDPLSRIVDRTQQSIINISNLDNNIMDIDVSKRARLYSEAVKRHDALIDRRKPSVNADDAVTDTKLIITPSTSATDILAQPLSEKITQDELAILHKTAELFTNTYQAGPQIECKEELIAYMSLDD